MAKMQSMITYRRVLLEPFNSTWSIHAAIDNLEAAESSLQNREKVLVLTEDDRLGPRVMLAQPQDMAGEGIDLCAKRAIKIDIVDFLEKSRADIAVDCILGMPLVIKLGGRLFFLDNKLL